jgi:pimeloyl-ACP methyl ester carboxylesterase
VRLLLLHAFPHDPSMWEAQRAVLAGHDVTAPSLYQRGTTMDQWAESLLAGLDGPYDCCVGASMGGGAALALERRRPGLLRSLVLAGAHAGPDAPERRPQRERQLEEYRDDPDKRAIVEALRDRPDDRAVVASFPGPLLVVVGAEDEMISAEAGHELAASAPDGRFALIEDAGHLVSLDAPEVFNALLADFLEELA